MRSKLFYLILAVFVLVLFSGFFWFYETRYMLGRASVSQSSFSIDNSYVFISPLRAKANGQEKIRVTVFILNNQGLGVLGKKVTLENIAHLTIDSIQGLTDNFGKAVFDVSSNQAGDYFVEIKAENDKLSQKANLSFY